MSAFQLKIIAIIAMTLNHVAHVFGDDMPDLVYYVCMGIGGMTFPIMAYFMAEGWRYTRNVRKYALRLLLFALLAFVPYVWTMGSQLNVLFTLLFGLFIIYLYETMKSFCRMYPDDSSSVKLQRRTRACHEIFILCILSGAFSSVGSIKITSIDDHK